MTFFVLYCGFWLLVAFYSAATAWVEQDPRYLLLTSTASLNIVIYKLTGKTRGEFNQGLIKAVKPKLRLMFWGTIWGTVAAGGVALSLHFDEPFVLGIAAIVVLVGWVLTLA